MLSVIISCNSGQANFVRPSSFLVAQADPQASSTNLQPRHSTQHPKQGTRNPHFIYTDFQHHLAHLADDGDLPASPSVFTDTQRLPSLKETKKKTNRSSSKPRSNISDSGFPYADLQGQLYDSHLPHQVHDAFPSSDLKQAVPSTSKGSNSHSTLPASPDRDLNQEIRLAQLQKDKLALELEILRLRCAPVSPDGDADDNLTSSKPVDNSRKKRAIDWPHEFAPGTSNSIDYDKLELPQFVAGFLAMIKPYDTAKKSAMLDYLELLMLKASSYSWSSVRAFHSHIAKQIELWRLEWTSSNEIRDKAVTFFKHSDLRSSHQSANVSMVSFPVQASSSHQRSSIKPEADKACRQWNYYGSCACDKSNQDAFNARHKCRVCTKDHPMLQCPKRRNPIPPQNSA